jgi:hypothetical protein
MGLSFGSLRVVVASVSTSRIPRIALTSGLAFLCIAIGLTMLHSPMVVAGTNRPVGEPEEPVGITNRSASFCQAGERLPRGTSGIRVWLGAVYGPRVSVAVSSNGRPVTGGESASGWVGGSVTVPVKPLPRAVSNAVVCMSFRVREETIVLQGNTTPPAIAARDDGEPIPGRIWLEYLRPGTRSWASLVPSVVRRMGFGRAFAGTWIAFVVLALLAAAAAVACSLVLRELR